MFYRSLRKWDAVYGFIYAVKFMFLVWFGLEWKKMFREVDDAKKSEIRETCLLVYTPFYLDRISKIKANNGRSKWLIGSKVTWADIYAYASLRNLEERATPQLLLNHPALQDFQREVSNIPKIKEFMKLRNSK